MKGKTIKSCQFADIVKQVESKVIAKEIKEADESLEGKIGKTTKTIRECDRGPNKQRFG